MSQESSVANWKFLTSHGRVLLCIVDDPGLRLREMALRLGITERHVYGIIRDLERGGYITKERIGRRIRYHVHDRISLPEALRRDRTIGAVLGVLTRVDDQLR